MTKARFPKKAFELLQDELLGASEEEVAEVLDSILRFAREEVKLRFREPHAVKTWNRATALAEIHRALAKRDPMVVAVREFKHPARFRLLLSVISEARRVFESKSPLTSACREDALILPGLLFDPEAHSVALGLEWFASTRPNLRVIIRWAVREARRIGERYGIREEMAVIFLFLNEGFVAKPLIDWHLEQDDDDPTTARLHMEIDPTMTPDEVAKEYVAARVELGLTESRQQREKTYALGTFFSNLDETPDWRELLVKWDAFCIFILERKEWAFNSGNPDPEPRAVYKLAREVRHAIRSLAGEDAVKTLLGKRS